MNWLSMLMVAPLRGWAFMLIVGLIHGSWWPQVPTIGYWPAVVIAGGLASVLETTTTRAPERQE